MARAKGTYLYVPYCVLDVHILLTFSCLTCSTSVGIFKNLQKLFQKSNLILPDVLTAKDSAMEHLKIMKDLPIPGGGGGRGAGFGE